ncbi:hypothetical protein [Chamaesiphon sp. OTE_20_metabat_361]|nr:hypothetical protein [Chamaesiphon sp. OTE_20_metabat_361]
MKSRRGFLSVRFTKQGKVYALYPNSATPTFAIHDPLFTIHDPLSTLDV